ncbi:hypothetical protein HKD37_17G048335 [Glycine soja]
MVPPPASPPPPLPPPPLPSNASASPSAVKRTRKASRLRSLSTRPPGADRPVFHADDPHRKKLRTYLVIVARDKAEFEIPEASDSRTKKKLLHTVGERWRRFKLDLTRKWALAADQDGVDDTVCEKYDISKEKWAQPVVHVDPSTGKADDPHRKKLRTYLGIVVRDKVDVTYENWKGVPTAQKDLIWEDIQAEFEIPEASDSMTKRKLLQTVGERWRQFKSDLTRKWALDQDGVDDTVCEKYDISKEKWAQMCTKRHRPSRNKTLSPMFCLVGKLLAEKTKKKLEECAQSGSVDGIIDPPSPVRRHVKWKMACTKKTGEMTTKAAKEIAEKIISHFQLTIRIIFQYFVNSMIPLRSKRHKDPSSPMDVKMFSPLLLDVQSTLDMSVLLEPVSPSSNTLDRIHGRPAALPPCLLKNCRADPSNQGPARGVHHRKHDATTHGIVQPDVVPDSVPDAISGTCTASRASGWSLRSLRNDPETGDSDRCGLYIEADPNYLVALRRVYKGSTVVHNTPLLPGQVKVGVEEVTDADAPVPVSINEVSLARQAIHTFLAWPTHLVKSLSQQAAVSPAKPPQKPDPEVDDPLYLMTLTIPKLFLRPYQVTWDATMFGVFNPDFPLYIKHEDLSEIPHGGQCLSISVLQLWILHLTETSMRARNSDIYGFLEPQSGQSQFETESYIKSWMQSSKCNVYLKAYLNGPDNYLKGIINSALKGLDDAPQPKSKAPTRWIVVKTIGAKEIKGIADPVGTVLSTNQTPTVATYPSARGRRVTRGMRVPRKEYARSRHQHLFEENVGKTGKDAIYELFNKIGEMLAAQLAQASRVASSRSNNLLEEYSGGPKWAWVLFAPPFLLNSKRMFTRITTRGCGMAKFCLRMSSGPPPLDDKGCRMTKFCLCVPSDTTGCGMTKFCLRVSSGPPPMDDKGCRMTKFCLYVPSDTTVSEWQRGVRNDQICLRVSSGSPPLDDKGCRMTKFCLCVPSDTTVSEWQRGSCTMPLVATYPSAGVRRVTRGMRVPRKEYAQSRHQRLFEENVGKTGKDAIYELLSERRARLLPPEATAFWRNILEGPSISACHRARRLWMTQGCRMTKFCLYVSSGPPPLDDKRVRITVRYLRVSSGPPPLDDTRVQITVRYLRVSSGPPPLDDKRVRITVRYLRVSSGPPPLDDKRVRITVRYLRVSSGPPPLDDTRVHVT